jgi:hypothetical protein
MIERYTIKTAPAVSHKDILKKLEEIKDGDVEALHKLQQLKVRIEFMGETSDLKAISDLLKELAK